MRWSPNLSPVRCCAVLTTLALLLPTVSHAALINGNIVDIRRATGTDLTPGEYHNYDPTYGGSIRGGEFRVTAPPSGSPIIERFKTLCLEYNEYISLGGDYKVSINAGAIQGGLGGATGGIDYLSNATLWWYTKYRSSTLDDLIAAFSYDVDIDGDALQLIVWRLEEEVDSTWAKVSGGSPLGSLAIRTKANALWSYYTTNQATIDAFTNSNVKVMNLWYKNATLDYNALDNSAAYRTGSYISSVKKQSQLYLIEGPPEQHEVPEPATLAVWGSLTAIGVVLIRRRRNT